MTRNRALTALLLISVIVFTGAELLDKVSIVVGDEPILKSEINRGIEFVEKSPFYSQSVKDSLKDNYVEGLINEKILYIIAKRDSIELDSLSVMNEVENYIENMIGSSFNSQKEFEEFLKANSMTESELRQFYFRQRKISFLKQQILFNRGIQISVKPAEVRNYYEENRDSFKIPLTADLYHISFIIKPDSMTMMSTLEKADALIRSLKQGDSFEYIAEKYSDHAETAGKGGRIGWKKFSELSPEVAQFLYAYKDADSILYTQSMDGFEIMKVHDYAGDSIDYSRILVSYTIDRDDSLRVKRKAETVHEMIKSGEIDFKEAASRYTEDASTVSSGGFIGNLPIESLDSPLKDILTDLEEDEVSDVQKGDWGYEIFMMENIKGGYASEFEEVRDIVRNMIEGRKIEAKIDDIIASAKEDIYIKYLDE